MEKRYGEDEKVQREFAKISKRREGEKMKPDPLNDKEMREAITRIVRKYDVHLVSLIRNIQWTLDVELDKNIYYKEQEKMEEEIRALGYINDIFYRDVA